MGAFYSTLLKLNEKAQEEILATTSDASPDYVSTDFKKLTVDNITLIGSVSYTHLTLPTTSMV